MLAQTTIASAFGEPATTFRPRLAAFRKGGDASGFTPRGPARVVWTLRDDGVLAARWAA